MTECIVCHEHTDKYKCPRCRERYCSLECYKRHKETPCELKSSQGNRSTDVTGNEEPTLHQPFSTDDTVPLEKLQALKNSEGLRNLLYNRHLRALLHEIDVAPNAWKAIRAAMQEPLFVEFADECLKVVEPASEGE